MKINRFILSGKKIAVQKTESEGIVYTSSFELQHALRGSSEQHEIKLEKDDVVEFIFDDDTHWFANEDTLHELFPESYASNRDGSVFHLPASIAPANEERGLLSNAIIKLVKIFSKKAIGKGIKLLAEELENKILDNKTGLFKLSDEFNLDDIGTLNINETYLLFIHGTAASTNQSFGGFKGTKEWQELRGIYGNNILTLQHESLSRNPVYNLHQLVLALPEGAKLDVITQSRGGLVGECLSRFCNDNENEAGYTTEEMQYFKKIYPSSYYTQFEKEVNEIRSLITSKRIKVNKFVRSACPAQGTTLASKRLDHTLNMLFNLLGIATGWSGGPVFVAFKALLASVVNCKNDVESLPGLEAMNPTSAFIKVLNAPGKISIDNNLQIISGNAKATLNLKGLLIIASKLFFLRKNDLIVDTESMYKGTARSKLVQYYFDEGTDVHHFRYFKNERTRIAVTQAIQSDGNSLLPGFSILTATGAGDERHAALGLEGGEVFSNTISGKKPILILIPGIMGSNLSKDNKLIWINYLKMINGDLTKISIDADDIEAPSLIKTSYKKIRDHFSERYDVVTYPFDWRKELSLTAKKFAADVEHILSFNQPVKIVAHSMGGVLVRDMMAVQPTTWKKLNTSKDFKLIFLGSPLGGSFRIPAVLFGKDDIIKKLSLIDIFHSQEELLQIFTKFPGILSLLPHTNDSENDFAQTSTWNKMADTFGNWPTPNKSDLDNFGKHRNKILEFNSTIDWTNAFYIAGKDKATPCGYKIEETNNGKELVFMATGEGDQSVTWESGIPKPLINAGKVYYVNVTHGSLANEPFMFRGIEELLNNGHTNLLPKDKPSIRGEEKLFRMPEVLDFDMNAAGIERTLLGLGNKESESTGKNPIRVSVCRGDLRYASYPMMAGHFKNDSVIFAEKAIDQTMKGALSERHKLGLYPGDIGTCELLLTAEDDFKGAIIVGLGEVGSLTSFELSHSIETAIAKYLLEINSKMNVYGKLMQDEKIGISSLAIGCAFGGLSIESSIRAIITGIQNANDKIQHLYKETARLIEHIEFIEQYDDKALGCFYTINHIAEEENSSLNIQLSNSKIKTLLGWKKRMPLDSNDDWWNRINIQQQEENGEESGNLRFTISTNGARQEQRILYTNSAIIKELFDEISTSNRWTPEIAKTIFELMIPNDFKHHLKKQNNISWLVDKTTAAYPWELLQDEVGHALPLCVNAGMIRQLATKNFRTSINYATSNRALIIADPELNGFVNQLGGAMREGSLASEILTKNGIETNTLIRAGSADIIKAMFSTDYKIIHLAGHGIAPSDENKEGGMVIGNKVFLTTKEIGQMSSVPELVFVNCCFLGKTDPKLEAYYQNRYTLAANIGTQLIDNGVKAVVVAGWAVDDTAAFDFAKCFYDNLFAGENFGDAVQKARHLIYEKYNANNNTWGAYQCYGDPYYRLSAQSGTSKKKNYKFLISEEAEIELNNLHNELETNRFADKDYCEKLEEIGKAVDEAGIRNPFITEKEALIYADLAEHETAIAKFESLFKAEQAGFSVSSLEKYCNIRAKKAVRDFRENKIKGSEALAIVNKVQKDLENILVLGETAERFILLAGTNKRKALLSGNKTAKLKAIKDAADLYMQAYKNANNRYPAFCLTNWYNLNIILMLCGNHSWNVNFHLNNIEYKLNSDKSAVKPLSILKQEIQERDEMDFWDYAAIASIELCMIILAQSKDKEEAWDLLLQSYRNIWNYSGTKGQKMSEIEQLDIFIDALSISEKKEAKQLLERILTLKSRLLKLI